VLTLSLLSQSTEIDPSVSSYSSSLLSLAVPLAFALFARLSRDLCPLYAGACFVVFLCAPLRFHPLEGLRLTAFRSRLRCVGVGVGFVMTLAWMRRRRGWGRERRSLMRTRRIFFDTRSICFR
jgi:hypothetical protein